MENISKEIIRKKTVDKDILLRKESTFDKYILYLPYLNSIYIKIILSK